MRDATTAQGVNRLSDKISATIWTSGGLYAPKTAQYLGLNVNIRMLTLEQPSSKQAEVGFAL